MAQAMGPVSTFYSRPPVLTVLVALALLSVPSMAFGQSGHPGLLSTWLETPSPEMLQRIREAMYEAGYVLANRGLPEAKDLFKLLMGIALTWLGLKIALSSQHEGFEEAIKEMIMLILVWGFGFWFLESYEWLTRQIGQGFEEAAATLAGVDIHDTVFNVVAFVGGVISGIFGAIGDLPWADSLWDVSFSAFFANLAATLLLLFFIVIMVFVGAFYAVIYIFTAGLFAFTVAIGPFMIPWILTQWTSFLLQNWLRLLLVAGMYNLVAPVIFTLIGTLLSGNMVQNAQLVVKDADGNYEFRVLTGLALMVIAVVFSLFLKQVPKLSEMLVGGGIRAAGITSGATQSAAKAVRADRKSGGKGGGGGGS